MRKLRLNKKPPLMLWPGPWFLQQIKWWLSSIWHTASETLPAACDAVHRTEQSHFAVRLWNSHSQWNQGAKMCHPENFEQSTDFLFWAFDEIWFLGPGTVLKTILQKPFKSKKVSTIRSCGCRNMDVNQYWLFPPSMSTVAQNQTRSISTDPISLQCWTGTSTHPLP